MSRYELISEALRTFEDGEPISVPELTRRMARLAGGDVLPSQFTDYAEGFLAAKWGPLDE